MTMGIKLGILIWIVAVLFAVVVELRSDDPENEDDLIERYGGEPREVCQNGRLYSQRD